MNSVGIVTITLAVSVFSLESLDGVLRVSGVPSLLQQGVVIMVGVAAALAQSPVAGALGRRWRLPLLEHPVVSGASVAASGILLVLTALIVR